MTPCLRILRGFLCYSNVYCYKGVRFEWHRYCGPFPLRKDGELKVRPTRRELEVAMEWARLPKAEQDKYLEGV